MADYFKCRSCDARLVGLANLLEADLGACPHCGETDWIGVVELSWTIAAASSLGAELTVEVGKAKEHEVAHSTDAIIAPELAQQLAKAFDPTIETQEPSTDWPTGEELDELDIRGDFVAAGLLLHAPGVEDDPDSPVIAELMIQGQWARP